MDSQKSGEWTNSNKGNITNNGKTERATGPHTHLYMKKSYASQIYKLG